MSSSSSNMQISQIRKLVEPELNLVDESILKFLESRVPLAIEIAQHLINSGGKRIRPVTLLLAAKSCGVDNQDHITLAAVIELIHTVTLLHDDVVDQSKKRRGLSTANMVWGNSAPVLVGDFLYSRAFQMMVSLESMDILKIVANGTNVIAQGEVLQLAKRHDPLLSEEDYQYIINAKTAKLFEVAAHLGGIVSKADESQVQALIQYGHSIGIAYQLVDDLLDYQAPAEIMGKNVGDDLSEGKTTLPLLFALKNTHAENKKIIHKAIIEGSLDNLEVIQKAIADTGAIQYTMQQAQARIDDAKKALTQLPQNEYTEALMILADFTIQRKS